MFKVGKKGFRDLFGVVVAACVLIVGSGTVSANESEEIKKTDTTYNVVDDELNNLEFHTTMVEVEEELPSLLPGDLFYFLKTLKENVQLAFSFDDMKESELLASFAIERIKEAEALMENGNEEDVERILEKAVEQQELALEIYNETEEREREQSEDMDPSYKEDKKDKRRDLEEKLSANVAALSAALDKVENPVAKKSLEENIERAKLENKGPLATTPEKENDNQVDLQIETEAPQNAESSNQESAVGKGQGVEGNRGGMAQKVKNKPSDVEGVEEAGERVKKKVPNEVPDVVKEEKVKVNETRKNLESDENRNGEQDKREASPEQVDKKSKQEEKREKDRGSNKGQERGQNKKDKNNHE